MCTYRIQIWHNLGWKCGLHDYNWHEAVGRCRQLKAVGIKARIRPSSELFN